ncbi:hypothetical protein HOLleu_22711 [Holothuria leucospilota]|uniref:Uncharacterized protein n=1 Tax=Holothuria leucospilota TaxID=206669 RepID=A0A9Q1BZF0_HOLLE|nr:hypothetical protein HOLleu_22711 [Holothuria leucospilota]
MHSRWTRSEEERKHSKRLTETIILSDLDLFELNSTDISHPSNEDLLRHCNDFRFHTFQQTDYNTFDPEQDMDADNNFFH